MKINLLNKKIFYVLPAAVLIWTFAFAYSASAWGGYYNANAGLNFQTMGPKNFQRLGGINLQKKGSKNFQRKGPKNFQRKGAKNLQRRGPINLQCL